MQIQTTGCIEHERFELARLLRDETACEQVVPPTRKGRPGLQRSRGLEGVRGALTQVQAQMASAQQAA